MTPDLDLAFRSLTGLLIMHGMSHAIEPLNTIKAAVERQERHIAILEANLRSLWDVELLRQEHGVKT